MERPLLFQEMNTSNFIRIQFIKTPCHLHKESKYYTVLIKMLKGYKIRIYLQSIVPYPHAKF